ncbi:MAG: PAS domain S-box protein [Gallionella sp.]
MSDTLHVLYAEDNAQDADLTRAHFAREAPDIQLDIAGTGASCLKRLAEQSFDLLLLDNRLPDMEGLDVLAKLRAEGRTLPVVMVTGVGDEDVVVRALRAGAGDYVSKSDNNYLATLPDLLRMQVARHRQHLVDGDGEQRVWHILYVEPNQMDMELTVRHLAADVPHLQLHRATSSRDALALLTPGHHFDLVLTDLRVPDMNAMELMREIQHRGIELPVIVITGKGDEASAVSILRLGAYDYIVKRDHYLTHLPHAIDHALHRFHLDQTTRRLNAELAALNATLELRVEARTVQLRQEMALRQASEAGYQHLIKTTHDLVQSVGPDGKFTFVNNAWCAALGWSREEALELSFSQIIKSDQLAHCQNLFSELKQGRNFSHIEVTFIAKDGNEITVEGNLSSIFVDGAFAGTQSFFRNITERKRAEVELRERERQLSTLISNLPGLAYRCRNDADYTMEFVSDGIENLTGYPAEDFLQHRIPFGQLILPDDQEQVWENIQVALQKRQPYELTYRIRTSSGAEKWVWEKGQGVRDDQGELTALEGFVTDITERKRAEQSLQKSEERFRATFELAAVGIAHVAPDGHWLRVNQKLCDIVGYTRKELFMRTFQDITHPDDLDLDLSHMRKLLAGETSTYSMEKRYFHKNGEIVWINLTVALVRHADGNPDYFISVIENITARKRAETQLNLAAKVFEQSGEAFLVTDADRNIVMVNHAFTDITGYSEAEVLGQNPRILSSGHQDQDFYRAMWDAINTQGHWQGELLDRRKDGSLYPKWLSISWVLDQQGKVTHYVGIFSDITQHKQDKEHIQRLAHFDLLTGLPNRVLLNDRVSHSLSMAQRSHTQLAVLFLDLDHFKNINDSLGHRIGDMLLVQVAQRLNSAIREEDTASRMGGDEFILVLQSTDTDGVAHVAEKLLWSIAQPYQVEQHDLVITPSIGIAMFPADGENFDTLYQCADVAMYRAKHDGRNNFRFFTPAMQANSTRRLQLENALRHALELNQLCLHYQPQMSLASGRIIGAEALLRWTHPDFGMVSPAEFIPIAEDSGLILPIGEWVLRTAARQMKSWTDSGLAPMIIAVNLSAVQFRHPNLPELVTLILDEVKLPPQYLELELTEGVAMDDPLGAIAVMDNLHARGIRMSIDDFGTGYSSLSYLKRFKVYKLKIDQSFVRDITDDPEDKAIVSAIISLAGSLGLQTIAEGVETEGQLAFLREQECNEMQGYYFSRPLPAEQFEAFVRGKRTSD